MEILKVLGQIVPTAITLTSLYTVPASKSAVISSIIVCNQNSSSILFRIAISVNGAALNSKQYIYYDLPLLPNDTFIATVGISLAAGDIIKVQSNTANVSFNLLGLEVQ